jgi:predicted nucleotidyltransferase
MPSIEKISIALSSELLAMVKAAVARGDYASTSEVLREALREWKAKRIQPSSPVAPRPAPLSFTAEQRRIIAELCRRYSVRKLALFGSAVRDDFDPATSDVDVAVIFRAAADAATATAYFDLKSGLESALRRPVDLVELEAMPESRLKRQIVRTQVPLYVDGEAA